MARDHNPVCPPESRCVQCWPDDSKNPALLSSNQQCAHRRVLYLTSDASGVTRGWWACEDCDTKFWPVPTGTDFDRLTARVAELTEQLEVERMCHTSASNANHDNRDERDRLRASLKRAGERLVSLARQSKCQCQATSGYTHHCEACRALKHAEDIAVMLRGDVPAASGRATDETSRCLCRFGEGPQEDCPVHGRQSQNGEGSR